MRALFLLLLVVSSEAFFGFEASLSNRVINSRVQQCDTLQPDAKSVCLEAVKVAKQELGFSKTSKHGWTDESGKWCSMIDGNFACRGKLQLRTALPE